jgi:hypothetical protein
MITSLESFIKSNASAISILDISPELAKEIQTLLKIEADGVVGELTKQAFAEFKTDSNLEYPLILGVTTAKELLELTTEETSADDSSLPQVVLKDTGSKTGRSMKLPTGEIVYANQCIVDGIPLTWGEATKDCARIPTSKEYVANAIKLAKTWGEVRDKFGSPLAITSGYRPPLINSSVGGAKNSQHLYFRALDMIPQNGDFKKLLEILKASDFTGIGDAVFMGRNKGFLHADIRPGNRAIFAY